MKVRHKEFKEFWRCTYFHFATDLCHVDGLLVWSVYRLLEVFVEDYVARFVAWLLEPQRTRDIPIFARNRLVTGTSVISHSSRADDEGCGCSQDPVTPPRDPASPAGAEYLFLSGREGTGNIRRRRVAGSVVLVLLVSEASTQTCLSEISTDTHMHLLVLNGSFRTAHLALTWSGPALSTGRGAAGKLATCLPNVLFEGSTRIGPIDFAEDANESANNVENITLCLLVTLPKSLVWTCACYQLKLPIYTPVMF